MKYKLLPNELHRNFFHFKNFKDLPIPSVPTPLQFHLLWHQRSKYQLKWNTINMKHNQRWNTINLKHFFPDFRLRTEQPRLRQNVTRFDRQIRRSERRYYSPQRRRDVAELPKASDVDVDDETSVEGHRRQDVDAKRWRHRSSAHCRRKNFVGIIEGFCTKYFISLFTFLSICLFVCKIDFSLFLLCFYTFFANFVSFHS